MADWVAILGIVVGFLGGGGVVVTWVLYRKQEKRLRNAESVEKEVEALRKAVETLERNQVFYEERLKALQVLVVEKDSYISVLSAEKHALEVKHSKNKSAINKAHSCGFISCPNDCVVLEQRAKNEEEYAKRLEKFR